MKTNFFSSVESLMLHLSRRRDFFLLRNFITLEFNCALERLLCSAQVLPGINIETRNINSLQSSTTPDRKNISQLRTKKCLTVEKFQKPSISSLPSQRISFILRFFVPKRCFFPLLMK